jgi:hypothetical protein
VILLGGGSPSGCARGEITGLLAMAYPGHGTSTKVAQALL